MQHATVQHATATPITLNLIQGLIYNDECFTRMVTRLRVVARNDELGTTIYLCK